MNLRRFAIAAALLLVAACTASEVASFDSAITAIESVISTASSDAQAACNAGPTVASAVNAIANIPSTAPSGGYTTAQQNVLNAEAAVTTVCSQAAPAAAAIIAALNQVETYAQSLVKTEEQRRNLDRVFGAVHRSMSLRALRQHRA